MLRRLILLAPLLIWPGCDDAADPSAPETLPIDMMVGCPVGATQCAGDTVQICSGGVWVDDAPCGADEQCVGGQCVGEECAPECAGRSCGPDGCGGTCGDCEGADTCNADGQCAPPAARCGDGVCDADETCVSCARDCGCTDPEVCDAQSAACVACTPQCDGRECGDDGCGGECGACGDSACVDGLCDIGCVPQCDGRVCGDDGCGGACGACDGDQLCDAEGACVAPPPACGDGQCGGGEDCSTCAEDCGGCCGDGQCGAGENCVSCAADCACPDGQRCAEERRACVAECVPQCDGRNCGDDGCGGDCGQCDGAQACEAGVCVDVCQPDCAGKVCGPDGCGGQCGECAAGSQCDDGACQAICQPDCVGKVCGPDGCGGQCGECAAGSECDDGACQAICQPRCDGLECGDDGCGGVCGVCEGDETCHRGGACRLPLVIDAPGVYPREGPRDAGRLVLAERAQVTLRLAGAGDTCIPLALNRIILRTLEGAQVGAARNSDDELCATLSLPLNAGEYAVSIEFFDPGPYTITAEFAPISDIVDAPGVYERLTINGDDTLTIQVAQTVVFAATPATPNLAACPFSATQELSQDGQLLANGVSRRGGSGCGRVLVQLEPGEYQLQLYSDQPDALIERYALHVAMTPMGPGALNDDAVIGRPGAPAGEAEELTITLAEPSILRLRREDGLGQCVPYRLGVGRPDMFNRARCNTLAWQRPQPAGEVTLYFDADPGLQPGVLMLDIEPMPTGDAFLPRSSVLRPDVDGDFVFVRLDAPSRVDFALEGPGAPCDAGIDRTQYDGYIRGGRWGAADGPCAWSALLDPGVHGFSYHAAGDARGVAADRRVTVTPLDAAISGPGLHPRARATEVERTPFALDAPRVVRVTAIDPHRDTCMAYDFALVLADGRRIEPSDGACHELIGLLPAGAHQIERQGDATILQVEFAEVFEGSGTSPRPATERIGDLLHLIGPPEAVLYISQFVDGVCAGRDLRPLLTNLAGTTRGFGCDLVGINDFDGHVMLSETGLIPERAFAMQWDLPRPPPFEAQFDADALFHATTVAVDTAGMMLIERSPCGDAVDDAPTVRGVGPLAGDWDNVFVRSSRCASAIIVPPGVYSLTDRLPAGAMTWSIRQLDNALAVPEQRPIPRIPVDGTYAAPIIADRAGRLHVSLSVNGGNCFLPSAAWAVFNEESLHGARVQQCEKAINVEAGQTVGVFVGPPGPFSGTISTWWE